MRRLLPPNLQWFAYIVGLSIVLLGAIQCQSVDRQPHSATKDIVISADRTHLYQIRAGRALKLRCAEQIPANDGWIQRIYASQCTPIDSIELNEFRDRLTQHFLDANNLTQRPSQLRSAVENVLVAMAEEDFTYFYRPNAQRQGIVYELIKMVPELFVNDPLVEPGPSNPPDPIEPSDPVVPDPVDPDPVDPDPVDPDPVDDSGDFQLLTEAAPEQIEFAGQRLNKASHVLQKTFSNVGVSSRDGVSNNLQFRVPANTVGLSVSVLNDSVEDFYFVHSLSTPDQSEIISPNPAGVASNVLERVRGRGQRVSPNAMSWSGFQRASTTPIPINDRIAAQPGLWSLKIACETPERCRSGRVQVVVLAKTFQGNRIDEAVGRYALNIHIAPGSNVGTAREARSRLPRSIREMVEFYARQNIHVEIVGIQELSNRFDDATQTQRTTGLPNDTFLQLMDYEKRPGAANVFFLKPSNYIQYAGIATFSGLSLSNLANGFHGIIIHPRTRNEPGATLAHEMGHHLGLYHTDVDTIDDTQDPNHWLEGEQRAPFNNLMGVGAGGLVLSQGQLYVLQRSTGLPLYTR